MGQLDWAPQVRWPRAVPGPFESSTPRLRPRSNPASTSEAAPRRHSAPCLVPLPARVQNQQPLSQRSLSTAVDPPFSRDGSGLLEQKHSPGHSNVEQSIVPDLVTSHHPESSPLQVPGPQMWEIKRAWSVQSFARLTGEANGLSDLHRPHPRSGPMSGANRREALISKEYDAKARRSDAKFGAPGSTAVAQALAGMAQVRGLAVGAFGEFSETVFKLIDGLAHEGALKNPDRFGQSSYKAAYGLRLWLLYDGDVALVACCFCFVLRTGS